MQALGRSLDLLIHGFTLTSASDLAILAITDNLFGLPREHIRRQLLTGRRLTRPFLHAALSGG
jgi:hypothetical protein